MGCSSTGRWGAGAGGSGVRWVIGRGVQGVVLGHDGDEMRCLGVWTGAAAVRERVCTVPNVG